MNQGKYSQQTLT